jgi:hypothetical protein
VPGQRQRRIFCRAGVIVASAICRNRVLTLNALELGQLPVKRRSGIPNSLFDFVDTVGLEAQPVDDLLGNMAGMIGQAFGSTTAGQPGIGAKSARAVIVDDLADRFDEWLADMFDRICHVNPLVVNPLVVVQTSPTGGRACCQAAGPPLARWVRLLYSALRGSPVTLASPRS